MKIKDIAHVNRVAATYFADNLTNLEIPRNYVLSRISEECAKKFMIGYCPYDGFLDFLRRRDIPIEFALETGLVKKNLDEKLYSFMYNRVIFPIFNCGMVVGFAGRAVAKNAKAKYLNIANNKLYNKSEILYILDFAKKSIYQKGFGILVEGQFDVLTLIDRGIHNVVASCGTAFTKSHARLLKRWCSTVYMAFDDDEAGKRATEKTKKILGGEGIHCKKIDFLDGLDPADFVSTNGPDAFLRLEK